MTAPQTDARTKAGPGWGNRSLLNLVVLALTVIASYWALDGWKGVARDWLGVTGWDRYLLFGMYEGVIIALILIATRTRLAGDAAGLLWLGVWSLTGLAVGVQVVHGLGSTRPESAVLFGSATLIVVLLWQLKTRQANREALRALELISDPAVSLGLGLWLRFPRWAWRAQTVARWEGLSRPAVALRRAQQLYPVGDMPWDRAHARASKAASKGGGKGQGQAASKGPAASASKAASSPATPPASKGGVRAARHTGVRPASKGAPATKLLMRARTFAIKHRESTGRLPGVEPLRKHLGIGQDAAKDLRDQVHAELTADDTKEATR